MVACDVFNFVTAAGCQGAAEEIADKVVGFSNPPGETEILSRLRHVFEYTLHCALGPEYDLGQFEVEIQHEKE